MTINKHKDSHTDHVSAAHLEWALSQNPEDHVEGPFYVFTVEMPEELEALPCGLYGPLVGDDAISDDDVTYFVRKGRKWASRLVDLPMRDSRLMTIIAGPHPKDPDAGVILHTVYGGPVAPQETGDIYMPDEKRQASIQFWNGDGHALSSNQ